jgi:hypothetical protein
MRQLSILAAAFACCAGTLMTTRDAHALGPVDLEIGAKAGVGTNPISGSNGFSAPNPLGFGLGARGGVDFLGFYGGVQLMYYFGSSESASALGETGSISFHTFMYGVEAGYGFSVSVLTIRPQIGIGNLTISESGSLSGAFASGSSGGNSNSNLYLEPGVTGLISLGGWFVGADANLLFLPGASYNTTTAFTLHGQIGIKL